MRGVKALASRVASQATPVPGAAPEVTTVDTLLDKATLCNLMNISDRTLRRIIQETDFPRPLFLNSQIMRWRAKDYNAWIERVMREGAHLKRHRQAIQRRRSNAEHAESDA